MRDIRQRARHAGALRAARSPIASDSRYNLPSACVIRYKSAHAREEERAEHSHIPDGDVARRPRVTTAQHAMRSGNRMPQRGAGKSQRRDEAS